MTAVLSIVAIGAAIAIGNLRRLNIGVVSIALAFGVGFFGVGLPADEIVAGWPLGLFFVLLGMTLLFGVARVNGTLEQLARRTVEATRGRTRLIPPAFFLMAGVLAAVGAGNIAVCALVLPIAMTVALEYRISPLLMATMVIAGSNAGGLSPIAPTGIIAVSLSDAQGLDIGLTVFQKQIVGQTILAAILYLLLQGHRLQDRPPAADTRVQPLNREQKTTIAVILLAVGAIVVGRWDIGLTAFAASAILLLLKAAEDRLVMTSVPWGTIVLVCGVTMLVKVAERAGGIDLASGQLTLWMGDRTAAPIMAVIGGTLSLVSSASGVVMPTLIPMVPGLAAETGVDPFRMVSAIVLGAHMVTNSPISTLGALAVASAGPGVNRVELFNRLFLIGLGGVVYAAVIVYLGLV